MAASLPFLLLLLLLLLPPLALASVSSAPPYARAIAKETAKVIKETANKVYMDHGITPGQQKDGGDSSGALVFDLSIGTAPQKLSVVMDITTELTWAQCDSCPSCIRFTPPATPTFLPNNSDSFAEVACSSQTCQRMIPGPHACSKDDGPCGYPDDFFAWNTSGFLASDTFTFGATPVPGVLFGCSGDVMVRDLAAGASGVAGFSRGPLSLVSQLNISSFTYYIAPPGDDDSKSFVSWSWGSAEFAEVHVFTGRTRSSSTPLLVATKNQIYPYLYNVKLTGVQVDGHLLTAIPPGTFDVRADGSGGVYLSSTLPVTYLEEAAYNVLRQELVHRITVAPVSAADVDHLCYLTRDLSNVKLPGIALMFDGANAAMELKAENYFTHAGQLTCLAIVPSTGGCSILGSLLQAGRTMTYDIHGGQLNFQTAAAAGAPAPKLWLVIMAALLVCVQSCLRFV